MFVLSAHDLGHVTGQGAGTRRVMQGLGYALSEQFDGEQGVKLTDTLRKRGVPTAGETPEITALLLEVPHPDGPLGAKVLAEAPSLAIALAIINAIYDAAGVRITDLPAARRRVLEAIQETKIGASNGLLMRNANRVRQQARFRADLRIDGVPIVAIGFSIDLFVISPVLV